MKFKCKNCWNFYDSNSKNSKFCSTQCKKEYNNSFNEDLSLSQKKKLLKEKTNACQLCGIKNKKLFEVHHIKPLSEGGCNSFSNLIVICANCHKTVHDMRT